MAHWFKLYACPVHPVFVLDDPQSIYYECYCDKRIASYERMKLNLIFAFLLMFFWGYIHMMCNSYQTLLPSDAWDESKCTSPLIPSHLSNPPQGQFYSAVTVRRYSWRRRHNTNTKNILSCEGSQFFSRHLTKSIVPLNRLCSHKKTHKISWFHFPGCKQWSAIIKDNQRKTIDGNICHSLESPNTNT